jgi:hypothetical protein
MGAERLGRAPAADGKKRENDRQKEAPAAAHPAQYQ